MTAISPSKDTLCVDMKGQEVGNSQNYKVKINGAKVGKKIHKTMWPNYLEIGKLQYIIFFLFFDILLASTNSENKGVK